MHHKSLISHILKFTLISDMNEHLTYSKTQPNSPTVYLVREQNFTKSVRLTWFLSQPLTLNRFIKVFREYGDILMKQVRAAV